jgi:hypothetical protein
MDTGEDTGDVVLNFLDETQVQWSIQGTDELKTNKYECRKADDRTYLVTYCLEGRTPGENHTWIIDTEQSLVTFLRCFIWKNQSGPNHIESLFTFGYIREEGKEHSDAKRHGFTHDVTGTCVKRTTGHPAAAIHVYCSSNRYCITFPKKDIASEKVSDPDEPAFYVKIKEGIYFISMTKQNTEKILSEKAGFHSDNLCSLDNWNRLYGVGRAFGTMTTDGHEHEIFFMIGNHLSPEDVDDHFLTDPNPYLV